MNKVLKVLYDIAPLLCSVVACIYILSGGSPVFIGDTNPSFHFDLITVNALFGGFLYTNYSLLIGILDNSIIEKVKNTDIIGKRNSHILKGIVYATVSVIAGLYLALVPTRNSKVWRIFYCFMQNAEIIFMAFLIIFFLLSLKEMSALIRAIHSDSGAKSKKEIQELRDKVNLKRRR